MSNEVDNVIEVDFKRGRKVTQADVHTTHCCSYHGCKYGDLDCTVDPFGDNVGSCQACHDGYTYFDPPF